MNTRGLTELVVVNVGFMAGLLDRDLLTIFIIMAVVTTVMTEPLLRAVYPDTLVRRDIAMAERAALGLAESHRVMVALRGGPVDITTVDAARMLLGSETPGALVLSRVVPPAPSGELGSGLSAVADALEGTTALGAWEKAAPVDEVPLTRIGTDPMMEWCGQAEELDVEAVLMGTRSLEGDEFVRRLIAECPRRVIVVGGPPVQDSPLLAVDIVDATGPHGAAVFEVGIRLALENGLPLVLERAAQSRTRRTASWLRRARAVGLQVVDTEGTIRAPVHSVMVGSIDTAPTAFPETAMCLLVRAGSSEPVDQVDVTLDSLARRPSAKSHVSSGDFRP